MGTCCPRHCAFSFVVLAAYCLLRETRVQADQFCLRWLLDFVVRLTNCSFLACFCWCTAFTKHIDAGKSGIPAFCRHGAPTICASDLHTKYEFFGYCPYKNVHCFSTTFFRRNRHFLSCDEDGCRGAFWWELDAVCIVQNNKDFHGTDASWSSHPKLTVSQEQAENSL